MKLYFLYKMFYFYIEVSNLKIGVKREKNEKNFNSHSYVFYLQLRDIYIQGYES